MLTWWSIRLVSEVLGCHRWTDKVTQWKPKWKINRWKSLFDLCRLLDSGGNAKVPDARGWELTGVQVRDMLHDLVKGINVVTLHSQRGLAGVEFHLRGEIETNRKHLFLHTMLFPKSASVSTWTFCPPHLDSWSYFLGQLHIQSFLAGVQTVNHLLVLKLARTDHQPC